MTNTVYDDIMSGDVAGKWYRARNRVIQVVGSEIFDETGVSLVCNCLSGNDSPAERKTIPLHDLRTFHRATEQEVETYIMAARGF